MGCTHEIKEGRVVTVINAGGLPGCSFCREDSLREENKHLRAIIRDGLDLFFEGGEWAPVVQRAQAALSDVPRTPQASPKEA